MVKGASWESQARGGGSGVRPRSAYGEAADWGIWCEARDAYGARRVWRAARFKKQDPGSFGSEVLCPAGDRSASMVGSNGLEPSTPCMSSKYSNQLS